MDYNKSIPDIYSSNLNDNKDYNKDYNKDDNNIIKLEIELEPFENISLSYNIAKAITEKQIILVSQYIIIQFEIENNNILVDYLDVWNKMIYFSRITSSSFILTNNNDTKVMIKIYVMINKKNKRITTNCIHMRSRYITNRLYTSYLSLCIAFHIIIICNNRIKDKIIKINSYNITIFYKVKELKSSNKYILSLYSIKNSFNDDYIEFGLYNLDNNILIQNTYNDFLHRLHIFNNNNKEYIKKNNLILPENISDPDGWDNTFYEFDEKQFMKKYDIRRYTIYELQYDSSSIIDY